MQTTKTVPIAAANSLEGRTKPFLERIENRLDEIKDIQDQSRHQIKQIREDIKTIYAEVSERGLPAKAVKALVKHRALARRQRDIVFTLPDSSDRAHYLQLAEALGPLGDAAAKRAGF